MSENQIPYPKTLLTFSAKETDLQSQPMKKNLFPEIFSIFGLLSVALGAFAAHGLRQFLRPEEITVFETGVRYMFFHSIAGLSVSVHPSLSHLKKYSLILFSVGIMIFSGSLFILSLSGIRKFGAVTPVGGVCLIAGWFCLFLHFRKTRKEN